MFGIVILCLIIRAHWVILSMKWNVVEYCSSDVTQEVMCDVITYTDFAVCTPHRATIKSHQLLQPISCLLCLTLLRDTHRLVYLVWTRSKTLQQNLNLCNKISRP